MFEKYLLRALTVGRCFLTNKANRSPRIFNTVVKPQTGQHVMIKIDREKWQHVITPEVQQLSELFKKYGYQIRMAGGAVRDILQGKFPDDVDFATNATPDEMKAMFNAEKIRMLNLTGEKHGTVTVRLNEKENFEVTTLRIDVKTDGRHAEVEFTKDWALDAGRRDLTVNSMFLELDGTLHDYFGGREDLAARRIRFVGNPADRIQEDYLRILRYFRFYSKIANEPNKHDDATLKAIKDNAEGLAKISGERIWTELRKFTVGRFAPDLITLMFKLGLGTHMGFPDSAFQRTEHLRAVYSRSVEFSPEPVTILSAVLESEAEAKILNQRLKLSNAELGSILLIIKFRPLAGDGQTLIWYKKLIAELCHVEPRCRTDQAKARVAELAKYCGDGKLSTELEQWVVPSFPVEGFDLMNLGVPRGKQFGKLVNDLKIKWINSQFELNRDELLQIVKDYVANADAIKDRSPLA